MKYSLRKRWHSSTNRLIHTLQSQLHQSDHSADDDDDDDDDDDIATNPHTTAVSNKWLERIASLYDEPHRAYHNMNHIEDVLSSLDILLRERRSSSQTVSAADDDDADDDDDDDAAVAVTTLSAFFHDVIYNPKSSTNEKDSADLFLEFASELCEEVSMASLSDNRHSVYNTTEAKANNNDHDDAVDVHDGHFDHHDNKILSTMMMQSKIISQIEACIIATATHISSANQARENNNILVATFLDADMSILGRDAKTYDRYAGCIRNEYEFVPREVYCEKRAEILESFLPSTADDNHDDADEVEESLVGSGMPNNDDDDETNNNNTTLTESSSRGEEEKQQQKHHEFIYATERGKELWEDEARHNLKREIGMLRRGVIPCEEDTSP